MKLRRLAKTQKSKCRGAGKRLVDCTRRIQKKGMTRRRCKRAAHNLAVCRWRV